MNIAACYDDEEQFSPVLCMTARPLFPVQWMGRGSDNIKNILVVACLNTVPNSTAFTALEVTSWSELLIVVLNLSAVIGAWVNPKH